MLDASSALARSVRRIAAVVCALGVVVVVLGALDGERTTHGIIRTYPAGGPSVTSWVFVMMIVGVKTLHDPSRRGGWFFAVWTMLTVMPSMVWWSVDHYDIWLKYEVLWPERTMLPLIGAMVLLACIALPIVLLTRSDGVEHTPPTARVVR
jgi:hypothetical protein